MSQASAIDTMRADFKLVAEWWAGSEGWSQAEIDEARDMVREAVQAVDAEIIGCWAAWLAQLAGDIRSCASSMREAEARMKVAAARARGEG